MKTWFLILEPLYKLKKPNQLFEQTFENKTHSPKLYCFGVYFPGDQGLEKLEKG